MNREQLKIKAAKLLTRFKKPVGGVAELILLFAFTALAYIFLLYYSKYLWLIFTYTQVGQAYAVFYEESYRITNDLFSRNIVGLTLNLTLTSLLICFIVGALLKFLHIIQYFYSFRGFFGRIIFAGLPLTYIVALYIHYTGYFKNMDTALTVAFVPTFCVFSGCLRFAEEFVPGLYDVTPFFVRQLRIVRCKLKGEEVGFRADEPVRKKHRKQNGASWKTKLHGIGESFALYMTVIVVMIVVGGILFAIPQIKNFNKSKGSATAETFGDTLPVGQSKAPGDSDAAIGAAEAWYGKALILNNSTELTDFLKGIEYLNEAIRLKPDYADAYRIRGSFHARLERYKPAINDYDEAIRLKPDDGSAYSMRGYAYLSSGEITLGCSDAKKACALGSCELLKKTKVSGDCR